MSNLQEKIIPIEWDGKAAEVVIRKITLKESSDSNRKAMQVKIIGAGRAAQFHTAVDPGVLQEQMMQKAICRAPFPLTPDGIGNLPIEIADKLFKEIQAHNGMSEEKKDNSDGASSTEPTTQN